LAIQNGIRGGPTGDVVDHRAGIRRVGGKRDGEPKRLAAQGHNVLSRPQMRYGTAKI
jgi:hypothetical protein